jgi:hypothetical protein
MVISKPAMIKTTDELLKFYKANKEESEKALLSGIPICESIMNKNAEFP